MRRAILAWCVGLCSILLPPTVHAQAASGERRVAMVIGERVYDGTEYRSLRNAENDARQVMYALADAGFLIFDRQSGRMLDCDRERGQCAPLASVTSAQLRQALVAFTAAAASADVALIYYSGHGVSRAGESYLVPSTDGPPAPGDYIPVGDLVKALAPARRDRILVVDACRSAGNARGAFNQRDISAAADGSFVKLYQLYATQNGNPSYDSSPYTADQSPFSAAFAKAVRMPGSTLDQVTRDVQRDVSDATRSYDKPQFPTGINQMGGNFAFVPTAAVRDAPVASPVFGDAMLATRAAGDLVKLALEKESLRSLEAKASAGDYSAAYVLYQYYTDKDDHGSALKWAEQSAKSGTPAGKHVLALARFETPYTVPEQKGLVVGKVPPSKAQKEAADIEKRNILLRAFKDNWSFYKSRYAYAIYNPDISDAEYWTLQDEAAENGVQSALRDYVTQIDAARMKTEYERLRKRLRILRALDPDGRSLPVIECRAALANYGNWDRPECPLETVEQDKRLAADLGTARIYGSSESDGIKAVAPLDYDAGQAILAKVAAEGGVTAIYPAYVMAHLSTYGRSTLDSRGGSVSAHAPTAKLWRDLGLELCKTKKTATCDDIAKLPQ